ncbi:MAG TPA: hypothetical protein PLM75_05415, partial [bacterium]|nr:hypothetical protein [bacterium]
MKLKYKIFISFIFVIIFITIYSHLIFVQRANTIKIKNKIEIVKNNYNNLNSFIEIVTMNLDLLTKQLTFIEISNAKLENKEYRYIFLSELRKKINNYLNINPKVKIDFDLVDYNTEILISTQPENIGKKICDEKTKYIDILKKRLLEQNVKKYTANYSNYIYILYPIFLNNNDNYKYLFILTINTNDFFQNLDLIENNGCLTNAKYIKHTQLS